MKELNKNTFMKDFKNEAYRGVYQNYIKRLIDIFICLMALPIFLICFFVISIIIKIFDNGPIFYYSKRIGKDFNDFNMYKFRSMKVNSPNLYSRDGSTYNSKNDPRVTKVGKFLRETSIDEIPQILNVLKGDMSIVGPRAGDVESKHTYTLIEKDKTLVKPGITGLTQAYFRNNLNMHEKRLYDAWYAHNTNFILDLKIILKTIFTVLKRENIYHDK